MNDRPGDQDGERPAVVRCFLGMLIIVPFCHRGRVACCCPYNPWLSLLTSAVLSTLCWRLIVVGERERRDDTYANSSNSISATPVSTRDQPARPLTHSLTFLTGVVFIGIIVNGRRGVAVAASSPMALLLLLVDAACIIVMECFCLFLVESAAADFLGGFDFGFRGRGAAIGDGERAAFAL
jgi:hypothetical protein